MTCRSARATSTCPRSAGCGWQRDRHARRPSAPAAADFAVHGRQVRDATSGKWPGSAWADPAPDPRLGTGSRTAGRRARGPSRGHRPLPGLPPVAATAPRLSAADVAPWQEQFAVAWRLIEPSTRPMPLGSRPGSPRSCRWPTTCPAGDQRRRQAGIRRGRGRAPGRRRDAGAAAHPRVPAREARARCSTCSTCAIRADRPAVLRAVARRPAPDRAAAAGHLRAHGRDRLLAGPRHRADGADAARGRRAVRPVADAHRRGDRDAGRLGRADGCSGSASSPGCAPPSSRGSTS